MFENYRKSPIQHCELRLHFEWTKFIKNAKNGQIRPKTSTKKEKKEQSVTRARQGSNLQPRGY